MAQPRLRAPMRVLDRAVSTLHQQPLQQQFLSTRINPSSSLSTSATTLLRQQKKSIPTLLPLSHIRYASHASQGRANGSHDSAGRRLGAKKSGDQYVIPGNIIFRQRGTKWFPGENCDLGRDHTIFATETGYVKYYLDPKRHPDRKYIGVAFNREDQLPTPRNAVTRRRLGMVAIPRKSDMSAQGEAPADAAAAAQGSGVKHIISNKKPKGRAVKRNLPLRPGYMYREGNWEIGRAADYAGIKVEEFNRKDRWGAWRKKLERIKRVAQMRELKNKRKGKKKAKKA